MLCYADAYRPVDSYYRCVLRQNCIPYRGWYSLVSAVNFLCHPEEFVEFGRTL